MLKLTDLMVHPHVTNKGADVPADGFDAGAVGAQDARVAAVGAVAVAFCDEAVLDAEAALGGAVVFEDLPGLTGGELEDAAAVGAVWGRGVGYC